MNELVVIVILLGIIAINLSIGLIKLCEINQTLKDWFKEWKDNHDEWWE